MTQQEGLDQIHEAAKMLRLTIEKYVGKVAVVYWGGSEDESKDTVSGLTLSKDVDSQFIEHTTLCMVGRIYNNIDYDL